MFYKLKLFKLILLLVHTIHCVNVTTNDQEKDDQQQDQQTRQEKLLKFGFGNPNFGKTEKVLMRNRLTNLINKISELERVRAKKSIFEKLQNVHFLNDACPPNTNSFRVGHKCYEHVTNLWMDYDSAFIYCNSRGGTLAQPHLENDSYLRELREYFPSLGENRVLVGITDMLQEGHFTYTDGTPVLTHRFYEGKFPVYADRDCVSLTTTYKGFGLVDTDCRTLHEVLCEYQPNNMLHHYYF